MAIKTKVAKASLLDKKLPTCKTCNWYVYVTGVRVFETGEIDEEDGLPILAEAKIAEKGPVCFCIDRNDTSLPKLKICDFFMNNTKKEV